CCMLKKQIVKKTSLFTLILAFLAIGTTANASVMNKEKGKDGDKEKVVEAKKNQPKAALREWAFQPVGSSTDMDDPNNYVPYDPQEHGSCAGGTNELCTIQAEEDSGTNKPLLNPSIPVTPSQAFYSPTTKEP